MSNDMDTNTILGIKQTTGIEGFQRLIISEVLKAEAVKRQNGANVFNPKKYRPTTIYGEGTMGVGKSQAVEQATYILSNILGVKFGLTDIRLAGMTGSDIQGIPIPIKADEFYASKKEKVELTTEEAKAVMLKWVKDTLLPGIDKTGADHGILFLDELNQVEDNSVRSLLYQLILDRKINDYVIPDGWYIVAAGNRSEDGGVYCRLPAPIRDRMLIVEIIVKTEEWISNFARPNLVHPTVISWIQDNPEYLHKYNPELETQGDEKCQNYVFATPRSWVAVSDALKAYESPIINSKYAGYGKTISEADLKLQICGLVGASMGENFYRYYSETSKIDLNGVLNLTWYDNKPNRVDVQVPSKYYPFLANSACYPKTDEALTNTFKVIMYLAFREAPATLIKIIINSLSDPQYDKFIDYCAVETKSSTLATNIQAQSNRVSKVAEELMKNQ